MQGPTHLMVSWYFAEATHAPTARDRRIVAWAGLMPDIDVLAYLAALVYYRFDKELAFENVWKEVHHKYTHNLSFVAVMGIVGTASAKPVGGQKWVLGVSNTLVGNGWREEMICAVKAQALSSGKVSKVIVANRNGGPAEQIADIRNLISAGANAIIINPSSASALNAVVAQAAARGVKIVSVDQRITAPQAYNVTNDQVAYGRLGAMWLFKKLGGKGNVVEMRRIAGVPADTDRHTGFRQALKKYPGIKVVN